MIVYQFLKIPMPSVINQINHQSLAKDSYFVLLFYSIYDSQNPILDSHPSSLQIK